MPFDAYFSRQAIFATLLLSPLRYAAAADAAAAIERLLPRAGRAAQRSAQCKRRLRRLMS